MQARTYKFPYLLIYTDNVPKDSAGCANAFIVRIKPAYKDDIGLEMHEATHVRQFWRTCGFHGLLYLLSKKYRLAAEVEAYRVQLANPPADHQDEYRGLYATFISKNYNLDIPEEAAYRLLG
jgi:hypothetical protein